MGLDNKISFISGFTFTALSTVSLMGVAQAAMVGLVWFLWTIRKRIILPCKKENK